MKIKGLLGDFEGFVSSLCGDDTNNCENSQWQTARKEWIAAQKIRHESVKTQKPLFLARCSSLGKLMAGKIGLSEEEKDLLSAFKEHSLNFNEGNFRHDERLAGYISLKDGKPLAKYQAKFEQLQNASNDTELPQGAKTCVTEWLSYHLTGCVKPEIHDRKVRKGLECEQQSIDLYNEVFGTSYEKNEIRIFDDYFSGTCDILDWKKKKIIDIKTVWDLSTFESKKSEKIDADYEWQKDGYLHLYNCDSYEIAYCLVDTPENLLLHDEKYDKYGNATFYGTFSHLPAEDRIFIIRLSRDEDRIAAAKERIAICQEKVVKMWQQVLSSRNQF